MLSAIVLTAPFVLAQTPRARTADDGLESISVADLREKIGYLASDQFMGRGDGTEELNKAAEYLADVFRVAGL